MSPDESRDWPLNYFNYFTEIEECFQRARGTGLFLVSPLDWALIETWKNAGVPLEAVQRGIDEAFSKWRARRVKTQMVNSLAFCAQAVLTEANAIAETGQPRPRRAAAAPFSLEELRVYLETNARTLPPEYAGIAAALEDLAAHAEEHYADLESLERRLTVLEEKAIATARLHQTEQSLLEARAELDRQLRPYRGKMTADQLAMLEKQFLERHLLEKSRPAALQPVLYALAHPQWRQELAQAQKKAPHPPGIVPGSAAPLSLECVYRRRRLTAGRRGIRRGTRGRAHNRGRRSRGYNRPSRRRNRTSGTD